MEKSTPPPSSQSTSRFYALDALRGIAVLLMVLSGILPHDNPLPAWMYHAQVGPLDKFVFNDHRAGLTWVDLVFPMFLFSMGGAIPLALNLRLAKGVHLNKILLSTLQRGALLVWFAIFLEHVRPETLSEHSDSKTWFISLLGFGLMFLMFTRFPQNWSRVNRWTLQGIGWAAAILLLILLRYPKGGHFGPERNDIIIIVLADMAVLGVFIWLATRGNWLARLSVLPLYMALRLSADAGGDHNWAHAMWGYSPLSWLVQWHFIKYLFIVIPGTIAGDQIVRWQSSKLEKSGESTDEEVRHGWLIALTCGALILTLLIGLQSRHVLETTLLAVLICAVANLLVLKPKTETERLIQTFLRWGSYWLILGLFFEPFEGGIKKDHSTLSYYFVTCGVSLFVLSAFIVLTSFKHPRRYLGLLIDVGQNPLIGYCAMENFIFPILNLSHLAEPLNRVASAPWSNFALCAIETLLLAFIVKFFTDLRIFWRA